MFYVIMYLLVLVLLLSITILLNVFSLKTPAVTYAYEKHFTIEAKKRGKTYSYYYQYEYRL